MNQVLCAGAGHQHLVVEPEDRVVERQILIAHLEIRAVAQRPEGEASARGNVGFDVPALTRIMVGICFAHTTFPKLFAMDRLPRDRLIREMARMTMYGMESRNRPLKDDHGPSTTTAGPVTGHRVEDDWDTIAPLLGKKPARPTRGRRPTDHCPVLDGIVDVPSTGIPWRALPIERYGVSGITCWRRFRSWQERGTWPSLAEALCQAGINLPCEATTNCVVSAPEGDRANRLSAAAPS